MNLLIAAIVLLLTIAMVALTTATGEITATRDISTQTVKPDEIFTVTVTITANQDIYAPILDENPQSGWTVTPIQNDGATFKESEIKWLWMEMLSAGTCKTVIYNVTVPSDAKPDTYYITGRVSAYQISPIVVGGKGEVRIEPGSTPCFIATAAYGTPLHEDIDVLRDFRDEYLMTNPAGRTFVKIYYTTSPPIAEVISEHERMRTIVREGLVKPLVYISRMFVR